MKVRFGVIGTNWITDQFIEAASQHDDFELCAIYSRTKEKAVEFANKYNVKHTFTRIDEMADSKVIDAVYIASPTSFHAAQTIQCLNGKKHVLCEKPIASNVKELNEMIEAAKENDVLLMEAMKTTLLPQFKVLQETLKKIGKIRSYNVNFCKYSSRYDAYREGNVLNAFKPEFSNGSLMDIGIYCIYPLVVLFGKPERVQANGVMLDSGVDGTGSVTLHYNDFIANIIHSKISTAYTPWEIQGEDGSILIHGASTLEKIEWIDRNGMKSEVVSVDEPLDMYHEAKEFIELIQNGQRESEVNSIEHSLLTAEILYEARQQIGLVFPADK